MNQATDPNLLRDFENYRKETGSGQRKVDEAYYSARRRQPSAAVPAAEIESDHASEERTAPHQSMVGALLAKKPLVYLLFVIIIVILVGVIVFIIKNQSLHKELERKDQTLAAMAEQKDKLYATADRHRTAAEKYKAEKANYKRQLFEVEDAQPYMMESDDEPASPAPNYVSEADLMDMIDD